jgi:hypothetical protein
MGGQPAKQGPCAFLLEAPTQAGHRQQPGKPEPGHQERVPKWMQGCQDLRHQVVRLPDKRAHHSGVSGGVESQASSGFFN